MKNQEMTEQQKREREEFIKRLLQEEQEQVLVDIITGKVLGKRKDVEKQGLKTWKRFHNSEWCLTWKIAKGGSGAKA